ncbi:MAG TPA: hypothetical protein P5186_19430 [Candidatus Paceibacterota bacterium]|nr:hypothetical protein [Verrucomicrobiota bacterium]HRY50230.1 hypothetical protein [Candidatus Paceibacterota bacterium]HRZ99361.1 hypothetical protein [Candidatus Paceibacterota bacterium]
MNGDFDFISPSDKPALLAFTNPEWLNAVHAIVAQLGYKIHTVINHEDFVARYNRIQYQLVVLEESFGCTSRVDNVTLHYIQNLPMSQRRYAVFVVIGPSYQTLNPMHAFCESVQAVINNAELVSLSPILQQVVADNEVFLSVYRDTQLRVQSGLFT